jgi:HSP20 family protein
MFFVPVSRQPAELSSSWDSLFGDSLFNRLWSAARSADIGANPGPEMPRMPALEVSETEHDYSVKLDLPGMTKDDVRITIDGQRITVDAASERQAQRDPGERVVYSERPLARFARSFTLPMEVDQTESTAKMVDGVLILNLAKRSASAARQLKIN